MNKILSRTCNDNATPSHTRLFVTVCEISLRVHYDVHVLVSLSYSDDPLQKCPELDDLMNHVAAKTKNSWYQVGIQLKIDLTALNEIDTHSSDAMRCYTNVFAEWKRANKLPYTWATIIKVLESDAVSEKDTASNVCEWLTDSQ